MVKINAYFSSVMVVGIRTQVKQKKETIPGIRMLIFKAVIFRLIGKLRQCNVSLGILLNARINSVFIHLMKVGAQGHGLKYFFHASKRPTATSKTDSTYISETFLLTFNLVL